MERLLSMDLNAATLGIDIGSTTVKIAILDREHHILFSDYERHYANIRETLSSLLTKAYKQLGNLTLHPMITGSGGLTLANHLGVPFTQEVIAVATSLKELAPKTDVAIELGGEDAKIIYFEGGNVEQRMNGICAGGTGSFIDHMPKITSPCMLLPPAAVYLPKQISSPLSTKALPRRICPPPFFRRW